MKTFWIRIKIASPDGHKTHNTTMQAVSLEDAMRRFTATTEGNTFMAVTAFTTSVLNKDEAEGQTYGVVFPVTSILEAIYQETSREI